MIKVATGFYIPATNITFIGNTNTTKSIKEKIKFLVENHRFLDLTKGKKIKSVIFYSASDGEHGVYSPLACETIISKYQDAKNKNETGVSDEPDMLESQIN